MLAIFYVTNYFLYHIAYIYVKGKMTYQYTLSIVRLLLPYNVTHPTRMSQFDIYAYWFIEISFYTL